MCPFAQFAAISMDEKVSIWSHNSSCLIWACNFWVIKTFKISLTVVLETGDTITDVALVARADVAGADLVGALGVCVTVVLARLALVFVNTFLGAPVVPGVSVLAVTFAIKAD